jgi:hypothetical protein
MPSLLHTPLPWLRVDRRRVFAVAGSMGGQESLLLLARFPRLLAGVVVFDAPTDLAARYYALSGIRHGAYLQQLMRREVGGDPSVAPGEYRSRSPIWFAGRIASSHVPVELWWSRRDRVVVDQPTQSGRLYRLIRRLNPRAPVRQVVGNWPHMAAMASYRALPRVLRWLGLLPASRELASSPGWVVERDEVAIHGSADVVSRVGAGGRFVIDGRTMFPIALAGPPPLGGQTPSGKDALNTVVSAGVNFFRVGPTIRQWKLADVRAVEDWDRAAAVRGVHTIVSLRRLSQTDPATRGSRLLEEIVTGLTRDASSRGIGLWRGADEPLPAGIPASDLRYAYCRVTSRGERRWCAGQPPLDRRHLWLTIQAPRGTLSQLAPYSTVTDSNGIDVYPVGLQNPAANLHQVGVWTHTLGSITPDHSVWTTLQICPNASFDRQGHFVLPTILQERYMIYDAIINGARGLGFFGGGNPHCWNHAERSYGWNWTFWNHTLEPLLREINARSPLAPALTNPASTRHLATNDSTTQAISRSGGTLWVIAARYGPGKRTVSITGLPPNITSATVYTEHRRIRIHNHQLTDRFHQWQVHVYQLTTPPLLDSSRNRFRAPLRHADLSARVESARQSRSTPASF